MDEKDEHEVEAEAKRTLERAASTKRPNAGGSYWAPILASSWLRADRACQADSEVSTRAIKRPALSRKCTGIAALAEESYNRRCSARNPSSLP